MGFSKTDAYSAEAPPPEREFPDLLTVQTRARESNSEIPPTQAPPPASRPRPQRYGRRPSALPTILLLIGLALLIGSLLGAWWTFTIQAPNDEGTVTYSFQLGAQYTATCSGGTDCSSVDTGALAYASHGLGAVGELYEGILGVELAALLLTVLACLAGLAGALGYWRGRVPMLLGTALALAALLLVLSAVISVAVLQPSALAQSGGGIAGSGSPSPGSSFWGSCSGGGASHGACSTGPGGGTITADWGASAGWFLALLSSGFLALGLWWQSRGRMVRAGTS
jgi:hypothetical protein